MWQQRSYEPLLFYMLVHSTIGVMRETNGSQLSVPASGGRHSSGSPVVHTMPAIQHESDAHSCVLEAGASFLRPYWSTVTRRGLEQNIVGICPELRPNLPGRFAQLLAREGMSVTVQVLDPQLSSGERHGLAFSSQQSLDNMRIRQELSVRRPYLAPYLERMRDGWDYVVKNQGKLDFSKLTKDRIIDTVITKPILFFYEGKYANIAENKSRPLDPKAERPHLHAAVCAGYYPVTDELLVIDPHTPKGESCHKRMATKNFVKALGAFREDAVQLMITV